MLMLKTLASAAALASLASLVAATHPQTDYAACPINHSPEYWCCQVGTAEGAKAPTNALYIKYNRPAGGEYESYYKEGWKKSRQINWVPDGQELSMYRPDSPSYVYGDPENTCRLQAVAKDGNVQLIQQCTFAPASGDDRFTQNTTLEDGTEGGKVYWWSKPNPKNNNAMLPIGATCTQIDASKQDTCGNPFGDGHYRFTTFKETAFVFLYVVYGICFGLLLLWAIYRAAASTKTPAAGSAPFAVVVTAGEDGGKKLLDNRGGPETPDFNKTAGPSLAMRATEVQLRHSVEDVEQVGHSSSIAGKFVFGYFILMTVFLNIPTILVIRDNTGKFAGKDGFDSWFDPVNVIIKVFIAFWVISAVWFAVVVIYSDKLVNFFRVPSSLAHCNRVTLFKPEESEVLLADRSGISQFVIKVEKFLFPNTRQGYEATVPVHTTMDGARYLEFQHLRYTYDDIECKFIPGSVVLGDTYDRILADSEGLSTAEHQRRIDIVGRNAIEVEMPSIAKSIVDEFFAFFYLYQLMCYYVWYFTDYTWVAALNTVVIVLAAGVNIYAKREMFSSIVKMTHYKTEVSVKRDDAWMTVPSTDLVPGDLVRVTENWTIPCDLVVVKGATVCDESMLTGESMPVQKFPVPNDSNDVYSAEGAGKKYTLFSGTKTLASGREEDILAVVQSTGAHTSRGQLVQAILYPAPIKFKYDEHLKAVFSFLFVFGFVAAYLAMKFLMDNAGLSNTLFAFVYGMFMFSAVLNPLLPVVITIGQVNAAKRLQKQNVFCLNPQRITLCGKVRVFCFDKTGTITKEGLDFRGCVPVDASSATFLPEVNDVAVAALPELMKFSLASTHALGSLQGELVGNEVEVKMFKSTQWKLIESEGRLPVVESADGKEQLEFVKRFEFDHHRMSMSVVMKHTATGKLYVFCKGSYEKMQSVSKVESVPANYTETAENLAKDGCYVLGIAFKEVGQLSDAELQVFLASRDTVEEGLSLLGLIMFRNELKEDSRDALLTLKKGDIRSVMITGDNAMTGCFIARASGMVEAESSVILGDMVADAEIGLSLVWKDVDTQVVYATEQIADFVKFNQSVELAVTGKAFDYLVKMGEIQSLLLNIRIFSRMTPAGKVDCVKLHMAAGAVTGMCGDGGNDCGALRIAHVGVALSDAEASVVSPFTSKTRSLQSIVDLVLEGRGALATSFGSVKYLIMYGLIGIGCRFVMYYNGVFVSQFGFMYLDGAILVGLSYGITRSRPLKVLGTQRPTSSLVGPTTLFSLIGAWVIHALFLFAGIRYVMSQVWYCPFSPLNVNLVQWWQLQDSNLGSSLWFLVCWQQMVTGITMTLGSKFRRPVWRNIFLVGYYLLLAVVLCILFLGPPTRFTDQFRVASSTNVVALPDIPLPVSFRWELFGIGMANTVIAILYEKFIVLGPVRDYFRAKYHKDVLPLKFSKPSLPPSPCDSERKAREAPPRYPAPLSLNRKETSQQRVEFGFRGFTHARMMAPATKAQERYDTPNATDGKDEEVEIEIRNPAYSGGSSHNHHTKGGDGAQSTMWLPQESNALEYNNGEMMPDTPVSMRQRVRNFLRLPNSAIKETWSRLDISDEGICEQEEYGEARDGVFWKYVHETLFGSSTMHGQLCGVILLLMIAASVILAIMDSVHHIRTDHGDFIYGCEVIFTIVFSVEYVLRVSCLRVPREYICSAMGIVDISSIMPTFITFFLPPARPLADLATLRIFRVIRVFRVLRLVRFVDAARALNENIDANKMRVAVFMFTVFSMIVVIGCTMYLIEGEENGFSNIPVSLYWAVVTLTTVGYGDIAPQTVPGRLIAAVVMFTGYGVIACPLVLNTQTEEEALRLNCECVRCFRGLHQQDSNFCRHCGAALRLPSKTKKSKKKKAAMTGAVIAPLDEVSLTDSAQELRELRGDGDGGDQEHDHKKKKRYDSNGKEDKLFADEGEEEEKKLRVPTGQKASM